ncbi:MAG: DUF2853 family protein [Saprospiraceae bacterium]|jgi:hypothetical protein|nr:DUF2853 family protein [Saprospiraceae bacterium]MBL0024977.1 DUF2853 family protein [Saprospiraceae bacterium]
MSKFDEMVSLYEREMKDLKISVNGELLKAVTKGCGPVIYLPDASKVSSSDQAEMDRVKNNFLIKKLGLKDSHELDKGIQAAVDIMGASNRNKYRAIFYYLLVKHFKKEGLYI